MTSKKSGSKRRPVRLPAGCRFTADDVHLFRQGTHHHVYDKLGAHPATVAGKPGYAFSVWAPRARRVSVVGSFNDWNPESAPLARAGDSGIWAGFVPGVESGALYKFHLESATGRPVNKADPFALRAETPPSTASMIWNLDYEWGDETWMAERGRRQAADAPMSVYEVHLGSWKRPGGEMPGYRRLADELTDYVEQMRFTHVELMPPFEHPFYGSWGYQTTGFFAPTSRYGTPQDLMYLIDRLHQRGIGVILDWVPAHFPGDDHGLAQFDGTRLYEYPDPRVGYQPDWKSYVFNYGRGEVRSFLTSSAMFWLERYHVDAIRVDAVASMLYLDYSREEGEWIRNKYGGRENLEAIDFLRRLNQAVHRRFPEVKMIAEESTAWPKVSRPVDDGGLGFDMKWDLGWMHDTLEYMGLDPVHRKFHHNAVTFRVSYAFTENFVLSLSHDEVVHGKASLLGKMFGDRWQRFASVRALLGYMFAQPGKKLLFMGSELGQWREWSHERELDWNLLEHEPHEGMQRWVRDLNRCYREHPALYRQDFDPAGFRWIDCSDADQSVISFTRNGGSEEQTILVVCNFTPVARPDYRIGVPLGGVWEELLNSDATEYGGSGMGNPGRLEAVAMRYHDLPQSLCLTLPPVSVSLFRRIEPPRSFA